MTKRGISLPAAGATVAVLALLALLRGGAGSRPHGACTEAGRAPRLHPDYAGIVIPPNIAPLNFAIAEPGRAHFVRISGGGARPIGISGRGGTIEIPMGPWRALLAANRGGDLTVDVYAQGDRGRWTHFETVRNHVAAEEIDGTLVFRWFRPAYTSHTPLGIYQRDLASYEQSPIVRNDDIGGQCVNCHTFLNGRPETFFFHLRGPRSTAAMMMVRDGKATAVETRPPATKSPAAYASWHPSGKLVAFSRNWIRQCFRQAGAESRDALDARSSLWIWWADSGKSVSPPELNPPGRMPTFPTWSPDGRWLYFCSTPRIWPEADTMPIGYQSRVRYDLMRASFDPATGKFGKPELFLAANDVGKTILEPRISPDGRWLIACLCEFGSFPVFQRQTDLYLIDLASKERRAVPLEPAEVSPRDSWHSWSSNSRWIVFSRKRENGLVARPYLRYIDAAGRPAKAFVVPQQDPTFYDRCVKTYNLPELVTGPVRVDEGQMRQEALASLERNARDEPAGGAAQPGAYGTALSNP